LPKFDAVEALRLIERHHVSTTFMAPTLLQRLCDVPDQIAKTFDTSSLRSIILGAAPYPYILKERANERFGPVLWEFYGATETGFVTILRPEDQLRKPGSCGTVAPGQEIRLLNEAGEEEENELRHFSQPRKLLYALRRHHEIAYISAEERTQLDRAGRAAS